MNRLLLSLALTCMAATWAQGAARGSAQESALSPAAATTSAPVTLALPTGFTAPAGYGDSLYPGLGDAGLDVTHYDLTLSATPGTDVLGGRAVLSVTARRDLTQIGLDFAGPPAGGMAVLGVKVNGQAVRHTLVGEKLLILPPSALAAGTAFTVTVAYSGTPALHLDTSVGGASSALGLRLGWITQAGGSYVLSEPDGAHTFFPCNDVPADGASYSLHVDVPAGYVAVASGVQTGQQTRGGRVYTDFELTQPIPTYALTVHVGHLELTTQSGPPGIAIRNAFPTGTPASVRGTFDRTPAMLDFLSGWFGPYPYPVYGVALSEDPQLPALETATLSTFPSRQEAETVALHELAHQWFGDNLRLGDWSDIWLNESFATYAELLWAEGQGQPTAPILSHWYARLSHAPARGLVATRVGQLFDASSYYRGALALHALRLKVGDTVFRQVLKGYAAQFSGRSVHTSDFLDVVREQGGQQALDAVEPWLTGPELPPMP